MKSLSQKPSRGPQGTTCVVPSSRRDEIDKYLSADGVRNSEVSRTFVMSSRAPIDSRCRGPAPTEISFKTYHRDDYNNNITVITSSSPPPLLNIIIDTNITTNKSYGCGLLKTENSFPAAASSSIHARVSVT